jgi:hypothetical protein
MVGAAIAPAVDPGTPVGDDEFHSLNGPDATLVLVPINFWTATRAEVPASVSKIA